MAAITKMATLVRLVVPLFVFLVFYPLETSTFPQGGGLLPSSQPRCRRSSPRLNDCVREGLTAVLQRFKSGDDALGVPPLDPLEIPFLQSQVDEANLTLDLRMRNIRIHGFSDIVLAKVTTNLDDVKKLEVTGKTPLLRISGEYLSEGVIVNFPLHSAGHFTINMTEVTSSWVVYLREESRGSPSVAFLQVDGFDVDMMPINISFRPAAQLDGDNHLGEAVNVILNENSHEVYSRIKSKLAGVFSEVLTQLANQVLSRVPESVYMGP